MNYYEYMERKHAPTVRRHVVIGPFVTPPADDDPTIRQIRDGISAHVTGIRVDEQPYYPGTHRLGPSLPGARLTFDPLPALRTTGIISRRKYLEVMLGLHP